MVGAVGRAVAAATGTARQAFPWGDGAAVEQLARRNGARAKLREAEVSFFSASPEAFLDEGEAHHPMSIAARPIIERAGVAKDLREQLLEILREGNEDPAAFRVTSRYVVIELTP
jgi:hypothetical protein